MLSEVRLLHSGWFCGAKHLSVTLASSLLHS
jgi:hypothetical protein